MKKILVERAPVVDEMFPLREEWLESVLSQVIPKDHIDHPQITHSSPHRLSTVSHLSPTDHRSITHRLPIDCAHIFCCYKPSGPGLSVSVFLQPLSAFPALGTTPFLNSPCVRLKASVGLPVSLEGEQTSP